MVMSDGGKPRIVAIDDEVEVTKTVMSAVRYFLPP